MNWNDTAGGGSAGAGSRGWGALGGFLVYPRVRRRKRGAATGGTSWPRSAVVSSAGGVVIAECSDCIVHSLQSAISAGRRWRAPVEGEGGECRRDRV